MARNRRELSPIFREILGNDNVYFQSPKPNSLKYPCIIYTLEKREKWNADNRMYRDMNRFTVTLIGKTPDNDQIVDQILEALPYCTYDRRFISENLYHDVFDLYY